MAVVDIVVIDNNVQEIAFSCDETHIPAVGDCLCYRGKEYEVIGRRFLADPPWPRVEVYVKGGWCYEAAGYSQTVAKYKGSVP